MARKKRKRVFTGKRKSLKLYEKLSLDLSAQIELADTWTVESFLSSDMTYHQWLEYITQKPLEFEKTPYTTIIGLPHHGNTIVHAEIKMQSQSLAAQQMELLAEAYEALDQFKSSRQQKFFLRYKHLFDDYRNLLLNYNRKFKKIIGRIKASLRGRGKADCRIQMRLFTQLISRNTDDEDHINEDLIFSTVRFLINNFYHYVQSRYNRHDQQPGIIFNRCQ